MPWGCDSTKGIMFYSAWGILYITVTVVDTPETEFGIAYKWQTWLGMIFN